MRVYDVWEATFDQLIDTPLPGVAAVFPATAEEARGLAALATKHNVILTVFHNRRWDADFLTLRKLFASEELGDVVLFQMRWDRFRPTIADRWKEKPDYASGMFYDLGSHMFDQVSRGGAGITRPRGMQTRASRSKFPAVGVTTAC